MGMNFDDLMYTHPVWAPLIRSTSPVGNITLSSKIRSSGIVSTCHPAAIPAGVKVMREHWDVAGS